MTAYWTTRAGSVVAIRDMTLDHRINVLHMLLRRAQRLARQQAMAALFVLELPETDVDEWIDDAMDPEYIWQLAAEKWPVARDLRTSIDRDSKTPWTPESTVPWIPVIQTYNGKVIPRYTPEEWLKWLALTPEERNARRQQA